MESYTLDLVIFLSIILPLLIEINWNDWRNRPIAHYMLLQYNLVNQYFDKKCFSSSIILRTRLFQIFLSNGTIFHWILKKILQPTRFLVPHNGSVVSMLSCICMYVYKLHKKNGTCPGTLGLKFASWVPSIKIKLSVLSKFQYRTKWP